MKYFLNRIAMVLLVTSLASVSMFAKTTTKSVKFLTNVKVNGTVVNKGVYDLKVDEQTGELSILKNDKVIARAATSSAKRDRKAQTMELKYTGSGDEKQLVAVAFGGSDQDLVINGSQASR
jgi:hypothetical protein